MEATDVKMMSLRRDGECVCGTFVPKGTLAGWHRSLRVVLCVRCLKIDEPQTTVDIGAPGASLEREYTRRAANREARVRKNHPWIGGLLLRLGSDPSTTEAFRIGAAGEREAAAQLARSAGDDVLFLYNRRRGTGRERGDIDMLAVAPSGVHIIDPKKYNNRRVRADRRAEVFVIDGRRNPALSASMRRQIDVVTAAVRNGPRPETPVHAAYCFIGANLPWTSLTVDSVPAMNLRGVEKRLGEPGPLDASARSMLHGDLALRFPPA